MLDALVLWRDRRGRLSWVRIATLALLLYPVALFAYDWAAGNLGGRPLNNVIHRTGWWALVFLMVSLVITPLRRSARFAKLIDVRRMIGVACFFYAAVHLTLYCADQGWNLVKVATEIVSRLYLTIGLVALIGLAVLAATSNDTMVKRLGGLRWRQLHQITFGITVLALIHFFQQTKADVSLPTTFAALFGWLVLYRILAKVRGEEALTPLALLALTIVASALTFAAEAIGISLAFGIPLGAFLPRYLGTILDVGAGIRPGWWVLAAGLFVVSLDLVRNWWPARAGMRQARAAQAAE